MSTDITFCTAKICVLKSKCLRYYENIPDLPKYYSACYFSKDKEHPLPCDGYIPIKKGVSK